MKSTYIYTVTGVASKFESFPASVAAARKVHPTKDIRIWKEGENGLIYCDVLTTESEIQTHMDHLLRGSATNRVEARIQKEIQEEKVNSDAINPSHYKEIVPGFQYFDVMDHMLKEWSGSQAHALGNALKYQMRLGKKDDPVQEIDKAIWYLTRLKADLQKNGKL